MCTAGLQSVDSSHASHAHQVAPQRKEGSELSGLDRQSAIWRLFVRSYLTGVWQVQNKLDMMIWYCMIWSQSTSPLRSWTESCPQSWTYSTRWWLWWWQCYGGYAFWEPLPRRVSRIQQNQCRQIIEGLVYRAWLSLTSKHLEVRNAESVLGQLPICGHTRIDTAVSDIWIESSLLVQVRVEMRHGLAFLPYFMALVLLMPLVCLCQTRAYIITLPAHCRLRVVNCFQALLNLCLLPWMIVQWQHAHVPGLCDWLCEFIQFISIP